MKKIIPLAIVVLGMLAFLFLKKRDTHEAPLPEDSRPKSSPVTEREPLRAASTPIATPTETVVPETVERDWMALTLQHQLTPDSLEAWAKKEGVPISRETKGHPASGERLEMIWGADPVTTASFDILGEGRYQLSAVRSLYPAGSEFNDLKVHMQHAINRPIEREDARSVVFRADEDGLVVWISREDDGRIKLAFEYGAHTHDAR
jgi:hypothetical protein